MGGERGSKRMKSNKSCELSLVCLRIFAFFLLSSRLLVIVVVVVVVVHEDEWKKRGNGDRVADHGWRKWGSYLTWTLHDVCVWWCRRFACGWVKQRFACGWVKQKEREAEMRYVFPRVCLSFAAARLLISPTLCSSPNFCFCVSFIFLLLLRLLGARFKSVPVPAFPNERGEW